MLEFGHAIAQFVALWPAATQRFGGRLGVPVRRSAGPRVVQIDQENRHEFQVLGGKLLCAKCMVYAASRALAAKRTEKEACPGSSHHLAAALKSGDQCHKFSLLAVAGQAVVLCTRCGAHSSRRVGHLSTLCRGHPTKRGSEALSRVRRGFHPHPRVMQRWEAAWRVVDGTVDQPWVPQ